MKKTLGSLVLDWTEAIGNDYDGRVWTDDSRDADVHVCQSVSTADGHGAYCRVCGEVLA